MKYHIDEHKNYIQKVMNRWQSIYRLAHAATGSSELAELVLQEALLEAYIRVDDGSLRENMRRAIADSAISHVRSARKAGHLDVDWDGFTIRPDGLNEQDAPVWEFMGEQSAPARRAIMLRYTLHWSPHQIADIMNMHTGEVKELMTRTMAQLQRRVGSAAPTTRNMRISPLDRTLMRVLRLELGRMGDDLPDVGAVMQAFEQDAAAVRRPNMTARKFTGGILRTAVVLLLSLVFYLGAIMAQDPFGQTTHVTQESDPDATAAPVLTLPALGDYEMIDAGRQMSVSDLGELDYYFTLPVARLNSDSWFLSSAYIRDERGIGAATTRAAIIEYSDSTGRMVKLRSMLPGSEACERLEDQMAYMGSNATIAGQTAVQLQSGSLCRVYTMIGQAVYCLEGEISLSELTELAEGVEVEEVEG